MKGGAATLARYMDQSLSIPTATSFRTLTVTVLDGRRRELKAASRKVSFTHLIAYAIARAGTDMPVMADHFAEVDGRPHRVVDGQVNLGLAVDVEKKDGSRTLMVPVIADAGRMSFDAFLAAYDALVEKARTNTLTADDLVGANITLTNPGGLGTIASVPRLMAGQGTIVATGSIAYPVGLGNIGAEHRRREGPDDDLHVRPPHHPGRRVRPLPGADRGVPAGRRRLLRGRVRVARADGGPAARAAGRDGGPGRAAHGRPHRLHRAASSCCRPCRPRAPTSGACAATATWPRTLTRSGSSRRATPAWTRRRSG